MKKTVLMSAAAIALAVAMSACSKNNEKANDTILNETTVAVGEVIDMPAEGTDTGVIATGEAVAVETTTPETNSAAPAGN